VLHASPAGWAMWVGLSMGAAIGFELLLWLYSGSAPLVRFGAWVRYKESTEKFTLM